jgi:hypothetical protein
MISSIEPSTRRRSIDNPPEIKIGEDLVRVPLAVHRDAVVVEDHEVEAAHQLVLAALRLDADGLPTTAAVAILYGRHRTLWPRLRTPS